MNLFDYVWKNRKDENITNITKHNTKKNFNPKNNPDEYTDIG